MHKLKFLALVTLAALLIGACSGAEPTATNAPEQDPPSTVQPTATDRPATSAPTEVPTEADPTTTQLSSEATATQSAPPATDVPVENAPPAFLEVGPDEWAKGPADAAVTIIEYSDFQ